MAISWAWLSRRETLHFQIACRPSPFWLKDQARAHGPNFVSRPPPSFLCSCSDFNCRVPGGGPGSLPGCPGPFRRQQAAFLTACIGQRWEKSRENRRLLLLLLLLLLFLLLLLLMMLF